MRLVGAAAGKPVSLAAVIGTDPPDQAKALHQHGADIAVPDLS